MIILYAVMAIIAVLLLIGYLSLVRKKDSWLLLLYICVAIVNTGYFLISVSKTAEFAVLANDIAYLGSVFLSMSMFLTIYNLCGFKISKKLVTCLVVFGAVMLAIVFTSGFLPWYYKDIDLVFVDGAAKLKKEYGILHPLYLIYLITYFGAMVVSIVRSISKKIIASQRYAVLLASIVFGNIAVWFLEKFIPGEFEFLSVSYLFSEIILLGLHWMMQNYVRVDLVPKIEIDTRLSASIDTATMPMEEKISRIVSFLPQGEMLTSREREILVLVLQNKKRKDIASELCLSENTVKTYTRTLYGKLGVRSREELYSLLNK